ncbi:MAG: O-antigen ligase family protein [Bacteroidaceae bacterium]
MMANKNHIILPLTLILGIMTICWAGIAGELPIIGLVAAFPIIILMGFYIVQKPIILLYIVFTMNYFVMGLNRYITIPFVSVIMDAFIYGTLLLCIIQTMLLKNMEWKYLKNPFTIGGLIWMFYCIGEIANPSGLLEGWLVGRNLTFGIVVLSTLTILLVDKYKYVKLFIFMFAIFSLMAALKGMMQKYAGFDGAEQRWLNNGGALTHIIGSGKRYFSFFTDASNYGSNMGSSFIVLGIAALSMRSRKLKIFYAIVSLLCFYAMLLSGTRGAIAVPLGGIMLYTIACKNYKVMALSGLALVLFYAFFAFTMIGQGNQQIRRMRTAFRPSEDASYNVRKVKMVKFGKYLKNKPFGEGIALSGVSGRKITTRFTTSMNHDSWYVKIWIETGIIGITLFLLIYFSSIGHGAYVLMFKVKDKELKGILLGFVCATFGLLISAYGNAFFGQYPTYLFVIMGLSMAERAETYDRELSTTTKD